MTDDPVRLTGRRSGDAAVRVGERLVLEGQSEWVVEGPADRLASIGEALGSLAEPIGDALLVNFGNAIGLFPLPSLGIVEVVSSKWTRHDFDRMLADLTRVASELPFTATTAASLPYDRSVVGCGDVLYHEFVYLRYILSEAPPRDEQLLPMLLDIVREPHRHFVAVDQEVPPERIRRASVKTLIKAVASPRGWSRVTNPRVLGLPLVRAFQGQLPQTLHEESVTVTVDTAENRFVKTLLRHISGVIEGTRREIQVRSRPDVFERRLLGDCDAMERLLEPVLRHALWGSVGRMVHLPVSSTILQRRRGYRQVFRHFARLRLAARVPLDTELTRDLLEAKDCALLYEVWCYFKVVEQVQHILGAPTAAGQVQSDTMEVVAQRGLQVEWEGRCRVVYNKHFPGIPGRAGGSYSVSLRPDITLEVERHGGRELHIMDAKFRVERLDDLLPPAEQADDVDAEERRGTFKRGDLYKMHAYRDAIRSARSVWVLYPGTERRFFGLSAGGGPPVDELPASLEGVGACPLNPHEDDAKHLRSILSCVLDEGRGLTRTG